ncbi:EAL domain-containing protein [Shewanella litorisediminis]|nr:EAL domain-containing protein [Shewanella litorisediminis]MCL2917726.1 EAL domain-containing protein [Shewanella litorisediminis]
MNILIVEDDVIQATSLRLKLAELGEHNIYMARDGVSALQIFKERDFSLIFCDIHMPQMDGVTLLSTLCTEQPTAGVVILSAADDAVLEITENMCHLAGFPYVAVMSKPYSFLQLRQLMSDADEITVNKADKTLPTSLSKETILECFSQGRIFNYYQPQFDFKTGLMTGVEALVRMDHPDYGRLSPDQFLDQVNASGLMNDLFETVLDKAVKAIAKLSPTLNLSVNICQSNLQHQIADRVIDICKKYHFSTSRLTLELTESDVYNNSITSLANLARLRMHGIGLSIDDFGTGYASLNQLSKLPFTELKVDRSFVSDIIYNYKHQQLTKMSLSLAQSLGMHCVIEGVEDAETWEYLKPMGAETCQGYYTSPPLSISALQDFYQRNREHELVASDGDDDVNVLLIDTHELSALALKRLLEKQASYIKSHITVINEDALSSIRHNPYDLVVIDACSGNALEQKNLAISIKELYQGMLITLTNPLTNQIFEDCELRTLIKAELLNDTAETIIEILTKGQDTSGLKQNLHKILSEQEYKVAQYLKKGLGNKAIANELNINQKTVSTYKSRIFSKLGIVSTVELVNFYN